jgi:glyoxylase-like metal-dependent hydrolase (beta-lactamase superfamily II)/rhodanese-related sulfurtransferase
MGASISIPELLARADSGHGLLLLDVRNDDEFEAWKLEPRIPVDTLHVPYFAFIEDLEASIARIPRGRDLYVLCAKGGSSEMVAGLLEEAGIPARNVEGGMLAYGDYLEPLRVPALPGLPSSCEIWQVNRRGKGCLGYVVRSGTEALVVDPSRRVEFHLDFVASLGARIVRVIDTHVHADHVSGGPELAARADAPYFVRAGDGIEMRHAVQPVARGERILQRVDIELLDAPGHTPGSILLRIGDRCVLTGDTLFVRSIGRPDLGGDVAAWGRALFRTLNGPIASLPDDTVVLPAHFAAASELDAGGIVRGRLGDLRASVPEMRIETEPEFVAEMERAARPAPACYAEILRVNLGQATASPERVEEWELGRNQCAAAGMGAAH